MGRPVKKKFFGNPTTEDGNQFYLFGDIGAGTEQCFIVKQTGTRQFRVESVNSGNQGEILLVNGPSEVTGSGFGYMEAGGFGGNAEVDSATIVAPGSSYDVADTVTLTGGTGTDAVLAVATVVPVDAQDETSYDGAGANGTFVGGDGAGGTAYVVADTITLTDGTVVTVDAIDANDDVTQFTVDSSSSTGELASGATLTQDSTSGSGTGFTLTLGVANQAIWSVTVSNSGDYSVAPTNPVSQGSTSGSGSGATFNIVTSSTTNEYVFKLSNKNLRVFDSVGRRDSYTINNASSAERNISGG